MDASLSTIILAAGRGSRMKSDLPKVLHQILGVPMIELVIEKVRQAGSDDLTLVLGHGADQVQRALGETPIRSAIQQPQRGTADAVLAALLQHPPSHPDVLVVNGDLPDLDPELLTRFVTDHRSGGSTFSVASARVADPQGMGRIVRNDRGDFVAIVEQQDADEQSGKPEAAFDLVKAFRSREGQHLMRVTFAAQLEQMEMMAAGGDGSTLLEGRNEKCLKVLRREIGKGKSESNDHSGYTAYVFEDGSTDETLTYV